MKTAKKLLCTVLVLVMAIGLIPFSASAAYTDAAKISYTEAVDVLSALKVLDGMPDGSFDPLGGLNRAQAAAYITRALLGREKADKLPEVASKFSDVPASHWASKYVAYCDSMGIIVGYGDGKFGPDDPVRGSHFAVMWMRALGIKPATADRWTGSTWEMFAVLDGMDNGLFVGADDVDYTAGATREQGAQYALNALFWGVKQVKSTHYEIKAHQGSSGAIIKLVGLKFASFFEAYVQGEAVGGEYADPTTKAEQYNIVLVPTYETIGGIAGDVHKLSKSTTIDAYGRPITAYVQDGTNLVVQKTDAKFVYTTGTKGSKIWTDLRTAGVSASAIAKAEIMEYVDGVIKPLYVIDNPDVTAAGGTGSSGIGTVTEVFYDSANGVITIVSVNTYLAKVGTPKDATALDPRSIPLSVYFGDKATPTSLSGYVTNDFARNDFVLLTFAGGYTTDKITSIEKAKVVESKPTAVTGTTVAYTSVTVEGTKYSLNKTMFGDAKQTIKFGSAFKFYFDKYNNLIGAFEVAAATADYARLVLRGWTAQDSQGYKTFYVVALNAKGEQETIQVSTDCNAITAGAYLLVPNASGTFDVDTFAVGENSDLVTATLGVAPNRVVDIGVNHYYMGNSTVFIFVDPKGDPNYTASYITVKTGLTAVNGQLLPKGSLIIHGDRDATNNATVSVVFVNGAFSTTVGSAGTDYLFFGKAQSPSGETATYKTYPAWLKGEGINVNVALASCVDTLGTKVYGPGFYSYKLNSATGLYSDVEAATGTAVGTVIINPTIATNLYADMLTLGGVVYDASGALIVDCTGDGIDNTDDLADVLGSVKIALQLTNATDKIVAVLYIVA